MSFANRFGRGLVAAMEEDLPKVPVEEVMAADSAESDLVEAADASAEVDAGVGEIESAQADSDTLGAIADTLEASEETGGLDPVAAQVAEVAVESIYARLGVTRTKMPAMEAFGSKETRVRATRIAVEDIRATLKKIWDAVVAAFGKVLDWVKNFFRAIFDANEKLATRADALEKRANATKGTAKETEMAAGGIAKALGVGGKFDKNSCIEGIVKLPKVVAGVATDNTAPSVAKDLKGLVQSKDKFDGFKLSVPSVSGYRDNDEDAGTGMKYVISPTMSGNKVIKLRVAGKELVGSEAFEAIGRYDASIVSDGKAEEVKVEKIEVLTPQEAGKIAAAARALTKAILDVRKTEASLEQEIKSLQADARSAASLAPKDDEAGAAARSRVVSKAVSNSINFSIKNNTALVGYAVNVTKSALDYAERSLGQYKEEKKTEEKK